MSHAVNFMGQSYEQYDDGAPETRECEAKGCTHRDTHLDDSGTMDQCQDCEGYFCPAHRFLSTTGRYDLCQQCREQEEIDAGIPSEQD